MSVRSPQTGSTRPLHSRGETYLAPGLVHSACLFQLRLDGRVLADDHRIVDVASGVKPSESEQGLIAASLDHEPSGVSGCPLCTTGCYSPRRLGQKTREEHERDGGEHLQAELPVSGADQSPRSVQLTGRRHSSAVPGEP